MPGMAATRRQVLARFAAILALSAAGGSASFADNGPTAHASTTQAPRSQSPTEVRRLSEPTVAPLPELQLAPASSATTPPSTLIPEGEAEQYQLVMGESFEASPQNDLFQVVPFYAPEPGDVFQNVSQDVQLQPLAPAPTTVQAQQKAVSSGLQAAILGPQSSGSPMLRAFRRLQSL
jgi:hypothetical protein